MFPETDRNLDGTGSSKNLSRDARTISEAINTGWIARGFKLGIGFWLAGLCIGFATFILFLFGGAALVGAVVNASKDANKPAAQNVVSDVYAAPTTAGADPAAIAADAAATANDAAATATAAAADAAAAANEAVPASESMSQ